MFHYQLPVENNGKSCSDWEPDSEEQLHATVHEKFKEKLSPFRMASVVRW